MLDTATKKRIDDCRDILVGKLPDPKAQIEQITIGLIYKFMNDMDKESIELGGKAKFFADYKVPNPEFPHDRKKDIIVPFSKYSWEALFNTKVTATEMLRLYSEAIAGMDKNPNIPQLFRDIFKNAFLPYRDPETLKLFLKTIGEFEYTHSEKLGDAFEYLLSVMGSQGDAGQFRTPRHIIDFLVAVVNPRKGDTILDPACGTAGFLISAFKHIKAHNKGSLTPDERKKLIQNFTGYDISPDMVRLSLVNLYLHGFNDPHIWEYDTLSSEERWDETADVILANPPFMSPKGGIRPHKKFSISSNRSEVLFVDYIAEHLNPKGRAGIIVPEGVIFQSGTAYKELRKMLAKNYLYAVVSLPAGVFNPYSGVKTSILLMDKEFAKKSKKILFVKIENDGYGLGAQRTPVRGSQLEEAIKLIRQFVETGQDLSAGNSTIAHAVGKNEIAKNGDYNLSGERYKQIIQNSSKYEYVELGEIAEVTSSKRIFQEEYVDRGIPFYRTKEIVELNKNIPISVELFISKEKFYDIKEKFGVPQKGEILISAVGTLGIPWLINDDREFYFKDGNLIWIKNISNAVPSYIKHILEVGLKSQLVTLSIGAAYKALTIIGLKKLRIPLPPVSIQEEIVAEIEGWQKIIDGAKAVVENYKPKININPDWEMVELGEVCEINPKKAELKDLSEDLEVSFVPMADLNENQIDFVPTQVKPLCDVIKGYTYFKDDDVLLAKVTPCFENGKAGIAKNLVNGIGFGSSEYFVIRPNQNLLSTWIYLNIITEEFRHKGKLNMTGTGGLQRVPPDFVKSKLIPLPPIETQRQIVSQIEKEQALVSANKQLIQIFEQKIKDRIAKVWGEEKREAKVYETIMELTVAAE
jgi:type I restriction enzyme M protein